jgi:uncharacterized protein (DUF1919 family)
MLQKGEVKNGYARISDNLIGVLIVKNLNFEYFSEMKNF